MATNYQQEIDSIVAELQAINRELEDIADTITANANGLGQDQCVACIGRAIDNYKAAIRSLNNVDMSNYVDYIGSVQL